MKDFGRLNYVALLFALCLLLISNISNSAPAFQITTFHHNLQGSAVAATDKDGSLLWREEYAPYGEKQINDPLSKQNDNGYTGHTHFDDIGLTYMGARYYDPVVGRFMSTDPVGFTEDSSTSFNRYAYANNNPYRYKDPNGESPIDIIFLVGDGIKLAGAIHSGVGIGGAAADFGASLLGVISPIPGTGQALKATKLINVTKNKGFYEVLSSASIKGSTRSAHRYSANKALANALKNDTNFAKGMNKLLDKDVLQHMQSGKGQLKNPPGTEWHHPKKTPDSMQLLRKNTHKDKELQDILHKGGTGGFSEHYNASGDSVFD